MLPSKTEMLYAIIGTWEADEMGAPVYNEESVLPMIIHEYSHSFINQQVHNNLKKLQKAGKLIYAVVEREMKYMAYDSWEVMIIESLVRASVIRYMKARKYEWSTTRSFIHAERRKGFIWIEQLNELLETYEQSREKFHVFKNYMPKVIQFYDSLSSIITAVKQHYEDQKPKAVSMQPFDNNSSKADHSITELSITFDKPLSPVHYLFLPVENREKEMPDIKLAGFADSNHTVKIGIKLEPNKTYSFMLSGQKFRSVDGYPTKDYIVTFHTKD